LGGFSIENPLSRETFRSRLARIKRYVLSFFLWLAWNGTFPDLGDFRTFFINFGDFRVSGGARPGSSLPGSSSSNLELELEVIGAGGNFCVAFGAKLELAGAGWRAARAASRWLEKKCDRNFRQLERELHLEPARGGSGLPELSRSGSRKMRQKFPPPGVRG
jgi:hypothetical protein